MSSRALTVHESIDLESRHTDLHERIETFNWWVRHGGWDQIQAAREELDAGGDWWSVLMHPGSVFAQERPTIPPRGYAVNDSVYGDVIAYPDPGGVIHFTATDNRSLVTQVQRAPYHSDPEYLALFEEIAARAAEQVSGGLELGTVALAAAAVIAIVVAIK